MCTHAITGETVAQRVTALSGPRECGSIGRAVALQAKGSEIETLRFHFFQNITQIFCFVSGRGWDGLMVRTLCCGHSDPGSIPGLNKTLFYFLCSITGTVAKW